MSVGSTSNSSQTSSSNSSNSASSNNALGQLDMDQFLKLMISELQNQDPMNPMDNSQMLQQISEIRSIGATDKLTKTLDAVLTGQNLATAGSMIGKEVRGGSTDGRLIEGKVESVNVNRDATSGTTTLSVQVQGRATALTQTDADNPNAQIQVTANDPGEAMNGVAVAFVDTPTLVPGGETSQYDSATKTLSVQIRAGSSTASDVLRAINSNAGVSSLFKASAAAGSDATGLVRPADSTILKSGGTQSINLDSVTEILPAS